jgi:hypothetical protein
VQTTKARREIANWVIAHLTFNQRLAAIYGGETSPGTPFAPIIESIFGRLDKP